MKTLYVLAIICLLLTSCGGSSTATLTSSQNQTASPTITQTSTSTPSPTNTPEPTVTTSPTIDPNMHPIFQAGSLTSGYDMGVDSSGDRSDWVTVTKDEMCMAYPSEQTWGSVFITVGKPKDPPRPSQDLSEYTKLSIELRGDKENESVLVGVKDNTQPDDGSEDKYRVTNLTTEWTTVEIPLSELKGADLSRLYVVTEFVFENTPVIVCIRKIQYLR